MDPRNKSGNAYATIHELRLRHHIRCAPPPLLHSFEKAFRGEGQAMTVSPSPALVTKRALGQQQATVSSSRPVVQREVRRLLTQHKLTASEDGLVRTTWFTTVKGVLSAPSTVTRSQHSEPSHPAAVSSPLGHPLGRASTSRSCHRTDNRVCASPADRDAMRASSRRLV